MISAAFKAKCARVAALLNPVPKTVDAIPGLSIATEDVSSVPENKPLELMSFSGSTFILPESHRYGRCKLITDFDKIGTLGEGAYGIVYKARDKKNNEIVALKKMKIPKHECLPINFTREINILKSLNHSNIVNMHGIAVGRNFETTFLVLEYCPFELSKVIDHSEARLLLKEAEIKCIMHQMFTGLDYVHQHFFLHRDLTVANILFTASGILKISDFGLARQYAETMTPNVVTKWYRAPELLFGSCEYTSAIDMWSAGCILGELLLKKPLFKADSDFDVITSIIGLLGTPKKHIWPELNQLPFLQSYELLEQPYNKLGVKFGNLSESCMSLLQKLFVYNPARRISAGNCVSHAYFNEEPTTCEIHQLLYMLVQTEG